MEAALLLGVGEDCAYCDADLSHSCDWELEVQPLSQGEYSAEPSRPASHLDSSKMPGCSVLADHWFALPCGPQGAAQARAAALTKSLRAKKAPVK